MTQSFPQQKYTLFLWSVYMRHVFACLGMVLFLAGVVCFFAYNWAELSRLVKFGILGALLIINILACLSRPLYSHSFSALLAASCFLAGVLVAIFGQVYQRGADAWEFFLLWTVLAVLLSLCSRSHLMWFFSYILANTTVLGLLHQMYGYRAENHLLVLCAVQMIFLVVWVIYEQKGNHPFVGMLAYAIPQTICFVVAISCALDYESLTFFLVFCAIWSFLYKDLFSFSILACSLYAICLIHIIEGIGGTNDLFLIAIVIFILGCIFLKGLLALRKLFATSATAHAKKVIKNKVSLHKVNALISFFNIPMISSPKEIKQIIEEAPQEIKEIVTSTNIAESVKSEENTESECTEASDEGVPAQEAKKKVFVEGTSSTEDIKPWYIQLFTALMAWVVCLLFTVAIGFVVKDSAPGYFVIGGILLGVGCAATREENFFIRRIAEVLCLVGVVLCSVASFLFIRHVDNWYLYPIVFCIVVLIFAKSRIICTCTAIYLLWVAPVILFMLVQWLFLSLNIENSPELFRLLVAVPLAYSCLFGAVTAKVWVKDKLQCVAGGKQSYINQPFVFLAVLLFYAVFVYIPRGYFQPMRIYGLGFLGCYIVGVVGLGVSVFYINKLLKLEGKNIWLFIGVGIFALLCFAGQFFLFLLQQVSEHSLFVSSGAHYIIPIIILVFVYARLYTNWKIFLAGASVLALGSFSSYFSHNTTLLQKSIHIASLGSALLLCALAIYLVERTLQAKKKLPSKTDASQFYYKQEQIVEA